MKVFVLMLQCKGGEPMIGGVLSSRDAAMERAQANEREFSPRAKPLRWSFDNSIETKARRGQCLYIIEEHTVDEPFM